MLIRTALIIIFFWNLAAAAAEPLQGPEAGLQFWHHDPGDRSKTNEPTSPAMNRAIGRQRRLSVDLPIPLALWVAMPFIPLRYDDLTNENGFYSDQRLGVGLLHHAAEGDPAWRIEAFRIGTWTAKPILHARALFNLVKHFPELRLRSSDTTFSWIGINTLSLMGQKSAVIPELSWYREGTDGLIIDAVIPKHIFMGYKARFFGIILGAEQFYRIWQSSNGFSTNVGTYNKQGKITLLSPIKTERYGDFLLRISAIKDLGAEKASETDKSTQKRHANMGSEISVQWIPNA